MLIGFTNAKFYSLFPDFAEDRVGGFAVGVRNGNKIENVRGNSGKIMGIVQSERQNFSQLIIWRPLRR